MQRTVLKKYILNQTLADSRIYNFSCTDHFIQRSGMLDHDQCAYFLLSHAQASHYHWHDIIMFQGFFPRPAEKMRQCTDMPMRAQRQEETTNLILKKDDQSNHTHIHQGIEYGAQQFHLQNLSDHQPDQDKNQNAGKNLDRAGGLHQFVGVVQQKGDQQYIDKIFYANVKKHGTYYLLQVINSQTTREYHQRIMPFYHLPYSLSVLSLSTIRTASTASRTSCTRRMFAPFINATVSSTVVPFNESCGVPPNSL